MVAPIDFYFDFGSPYAYLASERIDQLAAGHGRAVTWRPILLGVVFKLTGMTPNMHQPLRGPYLLHDTQRCARLHGIPYAIPARMPLNGLAASRVYYWLADHDPDQAKALARAVFRAHWVEGKNPETAAEVGDLARATLGLDPAVVVEGARQPAAKDRLKVETDGAIARGVFGAPFFFIENEPFWGADRLDMIDHWLAGRF